MKASIHGVTVSYEDLGSGPAVILLNTCSKDWAMTSRLIVQSGYRVIMPEILADSCKDRSLAGLVVVLVEMLDYLGVGRAVFCGDAVGDELIACLRQSYPHRVAGSCRALPRSRDNEAERRILEFLNKVRMRKSTPLPLQNVA